jgi:hypothetical protein
VKLAGEAVWPVAALPRTGAASVPARARAITHRVARPAANADRPRLDIGTRSMARWNEAVRELVILVLAMMDVHGSMLER